MTSKTPFLLLIALLTRATGIGVGIACSVTIPKQRQMFCAFSSFCSKQNLNSKSLPRFDASSRQLPTMTVFEQGETKKFLDQIHSIVTQNGGKLSLDQIGKSVKKPTSITKKLKHVVQGDPRFSVKNSIVSTEVPKAMPQALKETKISESLSGRNDSRPQTPTVSSLLQHEEKTFLDKIYSIVTQNRGKVSLVQLESFVKKPASIVENLKDIISRDPRFSVQNLTTIPTGLSQALKERKISESRSGRNDARPSVKTEDSVIETSSSLAKRDEKAFFDQMYSTVMQNGGKISPAQLEKSMKKLASITAKLRDIISGDARFFIENSIVSTKLPTAMQQAPQRDKNSLSLRFDGTQNSHVDSTKRDRQSIALETKFTMTPLTPRSFSQSSFISHLMSENTTIVVGYGSAGSGKTFIACHTAIQKLFEGSIQKIVLTRPIAAADAELGFLPGGIEEKMRCWMLPMYDSLEKCVGSRILNEFLRTGIIEISPLAYMRGRTFENCWVIGDEFQNCNEGQMRMVLTRIGYNCKVIITGDPLQCDLTSKSNGLADLISRIRRPGFDTTGMAVTEFTGRDVQRHPVVSKVLNLYRMTSGSELEPVLLSSDHRFEPSLSLDHSSGSGASVQDNNTVCLIDDLVKLRSMLSALAVDCYCRDSSLHSNSDAALALDIEGINLGSTGEICLVQIVSNSKPETVFLVDVCSLGSRSFMEEIIYDGRVI